MASSFTNENPDFAINFNDDEFDEEALSQITEIENKENEVKEPAGKKTRFTELEETALDDIVASAPSKKTNYTTKWGISVFKEWCQQRNIPGNIEEMEERELDMALRRFYAEVRNKNGENYSRSALLGFRYAIERFLNGPPLNKGIKICNNPAFFLSNQMLDAKIKQLKREGNDTTEHKPAIEQQDLIKLKTSEAILPSTPLGVLRNVWFHTSLYWCRRGREGQRSLSKSSFAFETDPNNNRRFVTMTHDEASKNHPGGVVDARSYEKLARMYETASFTDGYAGLKTYLSKLNPACDAFFQYPKRNWQPSDPVWFEKRPLGVNKLAIMMKDISKAANLSRIYTNHCVRSTAITIWAEAGLTDRQIMAISGHRNESSLKSYHNRPNSNSLQQCSDVLSGALNGNQLQTANQVNQCLQSTTSSSQNSQYRREIGSIFSTCMIDKVEIHYNR